MSASRTRAASPFALIVGALAGLLAAVNAKIALAAIAAAAVVILVFVGAEVLLMGVIAVEPWTDALQHPSAFAIPKIVGVLALSSWFLAAATGRVKLRFAPQLGWALLFLLMVIISMMLSPDPAAGVQRTISYALYVTFLGLFIQAIHSRKQAERYLAVYVGATILAAGGGLARFLTGAAHLASGPIGDPNDFALILSGAIPLTAYFAFCEERFKWVSRIGLLVIVCADLATLSRGALVGFVAVLAWALVTRRISLPGVLGGAFAVTVVLITALLFFQPLIQERLVQKSVVASDNVASREVFWKAAFDMSLNHPLFGVGPSRFGIESTHYVLNDPVTLADPAVHNSYLEILAEDGVFALFFYLCFLASSWHALRTVRRRAVVQQYRRGVRLLDALMASFVWTAVGMFFVSKQLAIPFFLIGGLAASLALSWDGSADAADRLDPVSSLDVESPLDAESPLEASLRGPGAGQPAGA